MNLPQSYDAWRLAGPNEDRIGQEVGDTCNRFPEDDEDRPRGVRLRRCDGGIKTDRDGFIVCGTCGEYAQ